MQRVKNSILSQDKPGFLVNAKFFKEFELAANKKLPPGEVGNQDLVKRGKFKPNMKQNIDYFVVDEDLWNEILMEYGGGPEVMCEIDSLGLPNLYPVKLAISYEKNNQEITISKATDISNLLALIHAMFDIPADKQVLLHPANDIKAVLSTEGTIGDCLNGNTSIEATIYIPEPPKPKIFKEKSTKEKKTSTYISDPIGLKNIGNTCYMNASIQSLLSLPSFTEGLPQLEGSGLISTALARLYRELNHSKSKAFDPKNFKSIASERIPFLSGTLQQDAHEFLSFLIDLMNEENPDFIGKQFYGNGISTTTCASCKKVNPVIEKFSSVSLPIASARQIIYSPWDLSEPMQRVCMTPDIPLVYIGRNRSGRQIADNISSEFAEILALEVPPCFDEEENLGLAIIYINAIKERQLCQPLIARVPLGPIDIDDLEITVWNRIQDLWETDAQRIASRNFKIIKPPKKFTMSQHKRVCNESIYIEVSGLSAEYQRGFKDIRTRAYSSVISLNELIDAYYRETQLDVNNKWKCEKCGDSSCAYRKAELINTPTNLIIQLKRFYSDNKTERDNSPVLIPKEIDLTPYFKDHSSAKYALQSVIHHTGVLTAGHYTAVGRREKGWYLFNDNKVNRADETITESDTAYILFFTKKE